MDEHGHQVAGVGLDHPEWRVDGPGYGAGPHPVLPRHVGDPAVTAFGRRAQLPGQPSGAAARVDDEIGIDLMAIHPDPGGAAPLADTAST